MDDTQRKMVNGENELKDLTTNGKMEQFTLLLEKEPNENHVKKKLKYLGNETKYPKAVFFIISNEFCERFTFYGMRAVLSLYLHKILRYDSNTSTIIYHTFLMAAYFFPIIGAIIADSFIGKYRTIFYLSVVYAIGNLTLAFASSPFFSLPQRIASIFGLFLIAFGTGGIKPCVSAFGGDQFKLPEQERQLHKFFSIFYFSINAGSLVSTYVTPSLRYNVHCLGSDSCYPLAFGVPALLMITSTVIFILGKRFYVMKEPEGNIFVKVIKCMSYAIRNKVCNKGEKKSHWLNYAEDKYDKKLIEETKSVLRVLLLFLPLPVFWALFDQQGSRWTFQATNMDGSLGWLGTIKPEQIQIVNPLLILLLIPVFETVIYPTLANLRLITTPLQKMSAGGLITALSFVVSGLLELYLQDTYAVLPQNGIGQIRLYNGLNCSVDLTSNSSYLNGQLDAFDALQIRNIPISELSELPLSIKTKCPNSDSIAWTGRITKVDDSVNASLTYLITGDIKSKISAELAPGYDVKKSTKGNPKLRILYRVTQNSNLTLSNGILTETITLEKDGFSTPMKEMDGFSETYMITINGKDYEKIDLLTGGVYTLLVVQNGDELEIKLSTVQPPNSVHILWQLPQYIIITAGEVMVSITGLELSYSQAPASMKSVLSATWLLTTSLGNLIVIVIAELKLNSQAVEFFTFAILMTVVMGIFMYIASRYRYVNESENILNENGKQNVSRDSVYAGET